MWEQSQYQRLGLGIEFRLKKIPRNGLGSVSVIPQKKVLIPSFAEEPTPKLGTEWNGIPWEKISFTKQPNNLTK